MISPNKLAIDHTMADVKQEPQISDDILRAAVGRIVESADLSELTSKKVRSQLAAEFQCDMKSRKAFVSECIKAVLAERQAAEAEDAAEGEEGGEGEEDEEEEEAPKEKVKREPKKMYASYKLSAFLGFDENEMALISRKDVNEKLREYFKEQNLYNPNDGRQIILDEALFNVFKVKKFTLFKVREARAACVCGVGWTRKEILILPRILHTRVHCPAPSFS